MRPVSAAIESPRSLVAGFFRLVPRGRLGRIFPNRLRLNPAALLAAVDRNQLDFEIGTDRRDRTMTGVDVLEIPIALFALHAFQIGLAMQRHKRILEPRSFNDQTAGDAVTSTSTQTPELAALTSRSIEGSGRIRDGMKEPVLPET